jgi:Zn-dependent protease with chaperone function
VLILNDTHWGFVALCGVVFVLPFASLPFSIGFKPTFLDLALGALFFVWLFKLVIGQQREFVASPLGCWWRSLCCWRSSALRWG